MDDGRTAVTGDTVCKQASRCLISKDNHLWDQDEVQQRCPATLSAGGGWGVYYTTLSFIPSIPSPIKIRGSSWKSLSGSSSMRRVQRA